MTARTATLVVACIGVLLAQVDTSVVNLAVHLIHDTSLGIWASMNGAAFVVGSLLGGILADAPGWRSLFAIAVPIALIALAIARAVPEAALARARRLDVVGQLFAALGLGALVSFAGIDEAS